MANAFDEFDKADVAGVAPGMVAPAPVLTPGATPEEILAVTQAASPQGEAAEDPNNAFSDANLNVDAGTGTRGLSNDEFSSALYDKLNKGDSVGDILAWSESVGHKINPTEGFYENIRIRDDALRQGKKGTYGRVDTLKEGESAPTDVLGGAGAFIRQAGNTALMNFGDETEAALRAIPSALMDGTSVEDAYNKRWQENNTRNELDWALHPGMSATGVGVGALGAGLVTPSVMNLGKVKNAGLAARAAAGGAEGAAYGAAAATGEGTPDDRFANTGAGTTVGAAVGTAFTPAMAAVERLGRPIIERMLPNEAKALAKRIGYSEDQVTAAQAEFQRQRDLGVTDITLFDVIDEPGRNVVGSAGVHDAARGELQDFAQSRATQLPERVAGAADEIITPASAPANTADEVRTGIDAQRDAEIGAAMDAEIAPGITLRSAPLAMTEDIADVLGTMNGQKAIRNVINNTADAAEREAYQTLLATARQRARGTDPRLGEDAQQAAQGATVESMPFTIGMSERLGRELNSMAVSDNNNGALFSFGRTVRGAAEQSPRYREVMDRYRQMSQYGDAVGVGSGTSTVMDEAGNVSRVQDEGKGFLNEPASRFEIRVDELSGQPMVDAEGRTLYRMKPDGTPSEVPAASERDLARLGATEQVATRAGRGPSEARNVASQLYDSPEQMARSRSLLGEAGADKLAGRMREEVARVYRAGKQATAEGPGREGGMAAVESGVNVLYNPASPVSWMRESARFLHKVGLSESDALWIVRNATDPSQTQALITRLQKHGMDQMRAQAYVDQLRDAAVRYSVSSEEN